MIAPGDLIRCRDRDGSTMECRTVVVVDGTPFCDINGSPQTHMLFLPAGHEWECHPYNGTINNDAYVTLSYGV